MISRRYLYYSKTDRLNRASGVSRPPGVRGRCLRDFPVCGRRQMTTVLVVICLRLWTEESRRCWPRTSGELEAPEVRFSQSVLSDYSTLLLLLYYILLLSRNFNCNRICDCFQWYFVDPGHISVRRNRLDALDSHLYTLYIKFGMVRSAMLPNQGIKGAGGS